MEKATANFVDRGRQIALENPDIEQEMIHAVEEVQSTGQQMSGAAHEFAGDPCSSKKRGEMVRHAKIQRPTCDTSHRSMSQENRAIIFWTRGKRTGSCQWFYRSNPRVV